MGVQTIKYAWIMMLIAYIIHTAWDTPYDWIIAVGLITFVAALVPDYEVMIPLKIIRSYWANRVDYGSWFKR